MRTYSRVLERLKGAGLRPTRQRLALAKLLLESGPRHVTAEELFHEARNAGIAISLATVYNTLHQFTSVGLLREVVVDMGQSYFDTNTSHHHHFFDEATGQLTDIAEQEIEIDRLPSPPPGAAIDRVEVIVRLAPRALTALGPPSGRSRRAACPRTRRAAASRGGLRSRPGTSSPRSRTGDRSPPARARRTTRQVGPGVRRRSGGPGQSP